MLLRVRRGWAGRAAALLALATAPPARAALEAPSLEWVGVAPGAQGEEVSALALDAASGALAMGDARGVRLVAAAGSLRRVLRRGPVRDVAFAHAGDLLAATDVGLFRIDAEGRASEIAPVPGQGGRAVARIAVSESLVAVAAEGGVYLSRDGHRWQRLAPSLPARPATAVALREGEEAHECFAVVDGRLWRVTLPAGESAGPARAVRETIPFSQEDGGPVDVAFGLAGADVLVAYPAAFAVRHHDGMDGGGSWHVMRPALPPGVRVRRVVAARGRLWLATDRGLLHAASLAGPWRRAAAPAGAADVRAVVSDGASLFVAAGDRVLVSRAPTGSAAAPSAADGVAGVGAVTLRTPEGDPPIEWVHRAALRFLDLRPERIAAIRAGVGRRGWLPLMSLRLGLAQDDDRNTDRDEAFLSGETRLLVDRERDRHRDFEASLSFTWDLGDVAYHPEQVDVSREAREIIKLRDDVLDEVTQLYFERRRVLAELAARPDAPPAEQLQLRLRAAELAAGIDAWTGGWWSRARAAAP